jgi:ZIP family zinc transporter
VYGCVFYFVFLVGSEETQNIFKERLPILSNLVQECFETQSVHELHKQLRQIDDYCDSLQCTFEPWRPCARRWKMPTKVAQPSERSEAIPWAVVFSIAIDAAVDGFLIGIAYIASVHVGYVMAFSTCIEMGFLGLTFSAQIRNVTNNVWRHAMVVSSPPLVLIIGGLCGASVGTLLEANPAVFVACLSFAIVALLFLVTQELLIEAHENNPVETWWVSSMFFVGVLFIILEDKFTSAV